MSAPDFDQVVEQGVALQRRFDDETLVAVGGTAASLHCGHRFSLDVDCVTSSLATAYGAHLERLESWDHWKTNRRQPPVLILGERHGVELGLRQLRRATPLGTTRVRGLLIPTLEETLRIKAFLLSERRAIRDFVDVAALIGQLGEDKACAALSTLNSLYPPLGELTPISAFAEAAEATPADLEVAPLQSYKGLRAPFADSAFVRERVQAVSRQLIRRELSQESAGQETSR